MTKSIYPQVRYGVRKIGDQSVQKEINQIVCCDVEQAVSRVVWLVVGREITRQVVNQAATR